MVKSKALRSSNTEHPEIVKLDLKIQQLEAELEAAKRRRVRLRSASYNYDENILALKKLMDEEAEIVRSFISLQVESVVDVTVEFPPIDDISNNEYTIEPFSVVDTQPIRDIVNEKWLPVVTKARNLAVEIAEKSGSSLHNVFLDASRTSYPSGQ